MNAHAVLFDIDGTLVDSNEFHVMAWDRAFQQSGHRVPRQRIRKQIGKGADMLIPALLSLLPNDQYDAIAAVHGQIFKEEYLSSVKPFPCAFELIQRIHEGGNRIILASSANQAEVDHYVELLGIRDFLTATTCADDVAKSKPAGDIFASALEKAWPSSADESIAIGDTPYDVSAAAKCGVSTIALRSGGFSDEELGSTNPLAIYDDVSELFTSFLQLPFARKGHK